MDSNCYPLTVTSWLPNTVVKMAAWIESRVFREHFNRLRDRLKGEASIPALATKLCSADLISADTRDEVHKEPANSSKRAVKLLSAVEEKVKANPSAFWEFVRILKTYGELRELASQLERACEKQN